MQHRKPTICYEREHQQRTIYSLAKPRYVTNILTQAASPKLLKVDVMFARPMPRKENGKRSLIGENLLALLNSTYANQNQIVATTTLLFSDPHFQWGRKIIICVGFFFQILPKFHFVLHTPLTQFLQG